jgi:hypothetical protein
VSTDEEQRLPFKQPGINLSRRQLSAEAARLRD